MTGIISIASTGTLLSAHAPMQRLFFVTGARRQYSLVSASRLMYLIISARDNGSKSKQRLCSAACVGRKYSLVSACCFMCPSTSARMQVARGSSIALSSAQTCIIMFRAFVGLLGIAAPMAV